MQPSEIFSNHHHTPCSFKATQLPPDLLMAYQYHPGTSSPIHLPSVPFRGCLEVAAADLGNGWVVAGKHWSRFVLGVHQLVLVVGHRKAKADAVLGKAD